MELELKKSSVWAGVASHALALAVGLIFALVMVREFGLGAVLHEGAGRTAETQGGEL